MPSRPPAKRAPAPPRSRSRGLTLLELGIALAVVGLLAAIAIPAYRGYVERTRVTTAVTDLAGIVGRIQRFHTANFRLPANLGEVGAAALRDPWGNAYEYVRFADVPPGARRKDRNLVPINTAYDLYSRGPDGRSRAPLTAAASRDDVVVARDGGFIGRAQDF